MLVVINMHNKSNEFETLGLVYCTVLRIATLKIKSFSAVIKTSRFGRLILQDIWQGSTCIQNYAYSIKSKLFMLTKLQ